MARRVRPYAHGDPIEPWTQPHTMPDLPVADPPEDPFPGPVGELQGTSGEGPEPREAAQLWLRGHQAEPGVGSEVAAGIPAVDAHPDHDRGQGGEVPPLAESGEFHDGAADDDRPKGVHRAPRQRAKVIILGLFGVLLAVLLAGAVVAATGSSAGTDGVSPQVSSGPSAKAEPTSVRGRGNTDRTDPSAAPSAVPSPTPEPPSAEGLPTPSGASSGRPPAGRPSSSASGVGGIEIQISISVGVG